MVDYLQLIPNTKEFSFYTILHSPILREYLYVSKKYLRLLAKICDMYLDSTVLIGDSLNEEIASLSAQIQLYLFENYPAHTKLEVSKGSAAYFSSSSPTHLDKKLTTSSPVSTSPPLPSQPSSPPPIKGGFAVPKRKPLSSITITPKASVDLSVKHSIASSLPITLSESAKTQITTREEMVRLIKKVTPSIEILSLPTPVPFPEIAILSLGETKHELQLLYSLAQSIGVCFDVSCQVVDWAGVSLSETKVILAPGSRLKEWLQLPALPVISLPELSSYIECPTLKASLWTTLCQQIQNYVK